VLNRGKAPATRRTSKAGAGRGGLVACLLVLWPMLFVGEMAVAADRGPRPKASVDDLKAMLLNPALSDRARIRAADRLGALDDPRAEAALELAKARDSSAVPLLIAALETPGPPQRSSTTFVELIAERSAARGSLPAAAARALGQFEAKEAVPALVQAAGKQGGEVRVAALEALTRLRASEAIPVAIECLGDSEPRARRWAANLLGELEARDGLGRLRSSLEDSDEGVRLQAIRALVKMSDVDSVDTLVRALEWEKSPRVRAALQDALASLSPLAAW